jgi:hypothetical protein
MLMLPTPFRMVKALWAASLETTMVRYYGQAIYKLEEVHMQKKLKQKPVLLRYSKF